MLAVLQREVKAYFTAMTGYIFCALVLFIAGLCVYVYNLKSLFPNFEYALQLMTYTFLVVVPILTMRVIAEERRQRTGQLLYSLPLSMSDVVLGKYFAMLVVLLVPIAVFSLYPLILSLYGSVYLPSAYCAIIGFFLLGAALVAIGLFISSLTESQVVSAVLCFLAMFLTFLMPLLSALVPVAATASFFALSVLSFALGLALLLLTKNGIVSILVFVLLEGALAALLTFAPTLLEGRFGQLIKAISFLDRFDVFTQGIFDLTAVAYFLAVIIIFVFLTIQSLEKRRWS